MRDIKIRGLRSLVYLALAGSLVACGGEDSNSNAVDISGLQQKITGACEVGQYVRAVNNDGSLECAAASIPPGGIGVSIAAFEPYIAQCELFITYPDKLGVFTAGATQCGLWAELAVPDNVSINRLRCRVRDVSAEGYIGGIAIVQHNFFTGEDTTLFNTADATAGMEGSDILLDYAITPAVAVDRGNGELTLSVYINHADEMAATLDEVGLFGCTVSYE